jgi:hypothetical protein
LGERSGKRDIFLQTDRRLLPEDTKDGSAEISKLKYASDLLQSGGYPPHTPGWMMTSIVREKCYGKLKSLYQQDAKH